MMMRDVRGVIGRLGGQGHGVLDLPDGQRAYVPFALPGEQVAARLASTKAAGNAKAADGVAAQLLEIETASPERIEPPCPHFHACGGCNLQHWQAAPYQAWKRNKLVAALQRRDWSPAEAEEIVAPLLSVPPASRRRAEFVARRIGKRVVIGFNEAESRRVVDLAACAVSRPALLAPLPRLREALLALLPEGRSLDIKLTDCEGGLDALFTGALYGDPVSGGGAGRPGLEAGARQDLAQLAHELGIARLCWRQTPDAAPEILAQERPPVVRFGAVAVTLPPGGFLQATAEAEALMATQMFAALPQTGSGGLRIADLFAGCGAFALRLAALGHQVLACDADRPAIAALTAAANAQQLASRIKAEARDLERRPLQAAELKKLDAVLLDPPRAGARAQAAALADALRQKAAPPLLLMAACDPNSFARDARLLVAAGYRLEQATPIDQFLWTPHLELTAVFRRA
ncbi:MAG: class I SAM-dependent RNA methyltransferase [Ferrovibrio sp.]|nr:class I SAM-dependent RNA methyltransferase [Ferrovibrio sp.]